MRCVALLRGVNVSGRKTVNMSDLKKAFEELGFGNVITYGQSGNVIFDCKQADTTKLPRRFEEKFSESFGFSTNVVIRTQQELDRIVNNNPLIDGVEVALSKLYVTFLLETPDPSLMSNLDIKSEGGEKFAIVGKDVYLYCPNGYARTKLNNVTFEKKLNTVATTRNWKTINNLLLIVSKL